MKWGEAYKALMSGSTVRRKAWLAKSNIKKQKPPFRFIVMNSKHGSKNWQPYAEDFSANDWEVVQSKKKKIKNISPPPGWTKEEVKTRWHPIMGAPPISDYYPIAVIVNGDLRAFITKDENPVIRVRNMKTHEELSVMADIAEYLLFERERYLDQQLKNETNHEKTFGGTDDVI